MSLNELQQQLNDPNTSVVVDYNGCGIGPGETLTIPAGKTLVIKNGQSLINNGVIENNSQIQNNGTTTGNEPVGVGSITGNPWGQVEGTIIIKAVLDFDMPSNSGKAIILQAKGGDVDLLTFGLGIAQNGGGTDNVEYSLSRFSNKNTSSEQISTLPDGEYLWLVRNFNAMNAYMGGTNQNNVLGNYDEGLWLNQNGDDAIELFKDVDKEEKTGTLLDIYGNVNIDGTNQYWEYLDTMVLRRDSITTPNKNFTDEEDFNNKWYKLPVNISNNTTSFQDISLKLEQNKNVKNVFYDSNEFIITNDIRATGTLSFIGTVQEGGELNAVTTGLSDDDGSLTFAHKWEISSDGATFDYIDGATFSSYTILDDQSMVDKYIRLEVVSTDELGGTTIHWSEIRQIANVDDAATGTLSFSGKVEKGSELSANTNGISDVDGHVDFKYNWQQSYDKLTFVDIADATSPNYTIPADQTMAGKYIRLKVLSTDAHGGTTRHTSISSASSVGDPYVFPLNSDIPVKLPNKNAFYRMFEQGNTFINASVSQATTEHMNRIIKYASVHKNSSVDNLIVDGYFYDKFFISVDGNELIVDLQTKQLSYGNIKKGFFKLKKCYLNTYKNNYFTESHKTLTIGWMTQNNKEISIDVMFFDNPQVENGIRFRTNSNVNNSIGMLIDNYKPKLMTIPMLQTTKYNKIHKRLSKTNNIHHFKNIIPKNETWK